MLLLSELKNHLIAKQEVSLVELIAEFKVPGPVIQDRMAHFINKGCVLETRPSINCGTTCQRCQMPPMVIYQWQR